MKEKQKLTLSVNKEVVERAKKLGLNISEITENILKTFTYEPTSIEDAQILEKYKEIFGIMLPLLRKFNTSVKVGEVVIYEKAAEDTKGKSYPLILDIELDPNGHLYYPDLLDPEDPESGIICNIKDLNLEILKKYDIEYIPFDPSQEILSNFVETLSRAAEEQKRRVTELEMVKRIIEAITLSFPSKERKGSRLEHSRNEAKKGGDKKVGRK
jgi:hypothetical protein